jgi:vacuolar-type H+-ATPase subunit H
MPGPSRGTRLEADKEEVVTVRPVSTILDRFRRGAGVPSVAGDDLATELAPVFAALNELEAEGERLRQAAREEADRRLAAAAEEATQVLALHRDQAEIERARAAAERRQVTTDEAGSALEAAEAEAREIRRAGSERIPELVAAVLACLQEPSR